MANARRNGCSTGKKLGYIVLGGALGVVGTVGVEHLIIGNDTGSSIIEQITAKEIGPTEAFDNFYDAATKDNKGLTDVVVAKYNSDRDAMKPVVEVCKNVSALEKEFYKSMLAGIELLEGAINPEDLTISDITMNGYKAKGVRYEPTGENYIFTKTEILSTNDLKLHKISEVGKENMLTPTADATVTEKQATENPSELYSRAEEFLGGLTEKVENLVGYKANQTEQQVQ